MDQIACCLGVDVVHRLGSSDRYCNKIHIFECERSRSYHGHHPSVKVLMTKWNMCFGFGINETVSAPTGRFQLLASPLFTKLSNVLHLLIVCSIDGWLFL